MRKFALALAGAALMAVAACEAPTHRHAVQAHHLANGSYAYQDDTGLWWYLYLNSTHQNVWQPGATPNLTGSSESTITLQVNGNDAPADLTPSVSVTAGGGLSEVSAGPTDASPSVAEAGGGSATAAGPTEASPSVDAGAASAGDAGGGGGGDGGGGGGE
jgi:hypothetical protein